MSGGYTPVFSSVFSGSLCGQYPDTAAWLFLLAMANKHGVVDVTPEYISRVTGMPVNDLLACIARFLEPDPSSRTKENEGRRLVLVDPARSWGWRIVNFHMYRERARKQAHDAERVSSGANAERMRARRRDPTRPDETRADPLSDADANTDTDARREVPSEPVEQARPIETELALVPVTQPGPDQVERVFIHWQHVHCHPQAVLTGKRRKAIRARLREYSEAILCQAISGYLNSPHHMGQNKNATKYDDIELFLRDAQHVEAGLKFHANPPRTDLSEKTRRIVHQTDGWVPPERRGGRHAT